MQNPADTLLEISMSFAVPQCLVVLTEMGVADELGDSPRSAAHLAAATGADPGALARALRLLSAYGIFEQAGNGEYVHNAVSRLLRKDHPQSMRSYVRLIGFPIYWQTFEKLDHSIRTGEPALTKLIPEGQWA
jgi:hypothetical protein